MSSTAFMKTFIIGLLVLSYYNVWGQNEITGYNKFVSLTGGMSTHGTGDMKGIAQKISFNKYFKKRLLWSISVGASIHDGSNPSTTTQPDGTVLDHSFRYTSGAIQISGGAGYSLIRAKKSELGLKIDGILRYQSSSYFDNLLIVFDPERTGIPYPATYIINTTPQRTYSVGVAPEIFYNHSVSRSIFAGISAGLQADTNGDILTNISLSIGKRFK
jgi:hypothetical protein